MPITGGVFYVSGIHVWRTSLLETGRRYLSPAPAKKKVDAICEKISQLTSSRTSWQSVDQKVGELNRVLSGWGNYFRVGYVTGSWAVVQQHSCRRLRQWMQRRRGRRGRPQSYPDMQLYERYGLLNLSRTIRRKSLWAKRT
jgi:RNA-directed DNA polymerase